MDIPTGVVGPMFGCMKSRPNAGRRLDCDDYDHDPYKIPKLPPAEKNRR